MTDMVNEKEVHRIVNVEFKRSEDLSEKVRADNGIKGKEFVEVRVVHSDPAIQVVSVKSPARRIKELLKEDGIEVKL